MKSHLYGRNLNLFAGLRCGIYGLGFRSAPNWSYFPVWGFKKISHVSTDQHWLTVDGDTKSDWAHIEKLRNWKKLNRWSHLVPIIQPTSFSTHSLYLILGFSTAASLFGSQQLQCAHCRKRQMILPQRKRYSVKNIWNFHLFCLFEKVYNEYQLKRSDSEQFF